MIKTTPMLLGRMLGWVTNFVSTTFGRGKRSVNMSLCIAHLDYDEVRTIDKRVDSWVFRVPVVHKERFKAKKMPVTLKLGGERINVTGVTLEFIVERDDGYHHLIYISFDAADIYSLVVQWYNSL